MNEYPFPLVDIKGAPRERGRQYGEQCKALIDKTVDFYRRAFKQESDLNWDESREKALEFIPCIEAYDTDIMEELRGIAEGARRETSDILAINIRSELKFLLTAQGKKPKPCCTSLAAIPEATACRDVLLAQNWDWSSLTREQCIILRIEQPGRPGILQVVEAGLIAKAGMNTAGIGMCTNALVSDKWRIGVPFHVVLRGILNAASMGEAIGAVTRAERASAANYLIAHREGMAIDIEAAPKDMNLIYPQNGILTHANHFQVFHPNIKDFIPALWPDTIVRDCRAASILNGERGRITTWVIQDLLQDHFDHPYSICTHPPQQVAYSQSEQTNVSIVMNLNRRQVYIAKGPPCEHDYVEMTL